MNINDANKIIWQLINEIKGSVYNDRKLDFSFEEIQQSSLDHPSCISFTIDEEVLNQLSIRLFNLVNHEIKGEDYELILKNLLIRKIQEGRMYLSIDISNGYVNRIGLPYPVEFNNISIDCNIDLKSFMIHGAKENNEYTLSFKFDLQNDYDISFSNLKTYIIDENNYAKILKFFRESLLKICNSFFPSFSYKMDIDAKYHAFLPDDIRLNSIEGRNALSVDLHYEKDYKNSNFIIGKNQLAINIGFILANAIPLIEAHYKFKNGSFKLKNETTIISTDQFEYEYRFLVPYVSFYIIAKALNLELEYKNSCITAKVKGSFRTEWANTNTFNDSEDAEAIKMIKDEIDRLAIRDEFESFEWFTFDLTVHADLSCLVTEDPELFFQQLLSLDVKNITLDLNTNSPAVNLKFVKEAIIAYLKKQIIIPNLSANWNYKHFLKIEAFKMNNNSILLEYNMPYPTPFKRNDGIVLAPDEKILPGDRLFSKDRTYALTYRTDGNIVITRIRDSITVWEAQTHSSSPKYLTLGSDGNFSAFDGSSFYWTINKYGKPGNAILESTGSLVLYDCAHWPYWSSKNKISVDELIRPGQSLLSPNGKYAFFFMTDGEFYLMDLPKRAIVWRTYINGKDLWPQKLIMQSDGNLCAYDINGKCFWSVGKAWGNHDCFLAVEDSGEIAIYNKDKKKFWSSKDASIISAT